MNRKQNTQKSLTPAGKLAASILFLLLIGTVGMLVRPLLYNRVTNVEDYVPAVASVPTNTPRPTITATASPAPPTAIPTPEGWIARTDSLSGKKYLAPPLAVEAQIREALDAVLGCGLIEDVSNEQALAYDRDAAFEKATQFTTSEILAYFEPKSADGIARIMLVELGPENPVQCSDYDTCTLGRAKVGSNGAIFYSSVVCPDIDGQDVCVIRPSEFNFTDQAPCMLYVATLERQENRIWKITNLSIERLPEPPSS